MNSTTSKKFTLEEVLDSETLDLVKQKFSDKFELAIELIKDYMQDRECILCPKTIKSAVMASSGELHHFDNWLELGNSNPEEVINWAHLN